MKGAIGMPMDLLVGIILLVILLLAGLYFSGILPGFGKAQTVQGYYNTCCMAFTIAGKCNAAAEDISGLAADFDCTVSKEMGGTMKFSQLASQAGPSAQGCCKK